MAEVNPPPPDSNLPPQTQPDSPPPPKKRRRWPYILAAAVLLIVVLVALLPTIAGSGWVRSIVLSQVNKNINGNVDVQDWSLSWTGGMRVQGLRIFQDGGQILQCRQLETQLSLWDIVRGRFFNFGRTTARDLDFLLKVYPDGTNSFTRLIKHPAPPDQPLIMPDIKGDIELVDFRGTIDQPSQPPIAIAPSTAHVVITDINAPITNTLNLAMRSGDAQPGKLAADGTIRLFRNNQLDLSALSAKENVELNSVDLAAAAPFFGPDAPIRTIQGMTSGKLVADLTGENNMRVEGQLTTDRFAIAGPALQGDTFRSSKLAVAIPPTTFDRSTGRIKSDQIKLTLDQGSIVVIADATQQAILNFLNNRPPGAAGTASANVDLDLAALAAQLPRVMHLRPGMKPVSGRLKQETKLTFSADRALIAHNTDLTELAATDSAGQRITAQPIHLTLNTASLGGGGKIPDLRDIVLALKSGFATIDGKGASLSQLGIDGQVNLASMQNELGQFIDFGPRKLVGEATFRITSQGDLTTATGTARLDANLTATNLQIQGLAEQPVNEPWAQVGFTGTISRSADQFIQAIRDGELTLRTGTEQNPTIDLKATGELALKPNAPIAAPAFEISQLVVNLPAAQKELRPLLPILQQNGLSIRQGTLVTKASGSYDGASATLKTLTADLKDITLLQTSERQPRTLLRNENITITARATANGSSIAAEQIDLRSAYMNVAATETQLSLSAGSPLDMVQKSNVTLDVPDLPRSIALVSAFMPPSTQPSTPAVATDEAAEPLPPINLRSGSARGIMKVARTDKGISLNVDELAGRNLVLERGKGSFGPRDANLKLALLVSADSSATTRPISQQIREIQVSQLAGSLGITDISLQEPIILRQQADGIALAGGAVKLNGELRTVANLLEALQAQPAGSMYDYAGAFAVTQRISGPPQNLTLAGTADITNFTAGPPQSRFVEPAVHVVNDISLDRSANALSIRKLSLDMPQSRALGVQVTGAIRDYATQRIFDNVKLLLSYDAAKVLDIVRPMLSPEQRERFATLKVAGVVKDREFVLSGKYPAIDAGTAVRSPIRFLKAQGLLTLDSVEYEGLAGQNFQVPLTLANGVLRTVYADKPADQQYPPPAGLNGGKVDFGGLELSLTGKVLRMSAMRKDYKLLEGVVVGRQFINRYLGSLNPLFTTADDAKGVIDVMLLELSNLPMDSTLTAPGRRDDGIARLTYSLTDLRLKSPFMGILASQLQMKLAPDGTLAGEIKNGTVTIKNGVVSSDLPLDLGGQTLGFRNGSVRLSDRRILSMDMLVPKSMIPAVRDQRFVKDLIEVPISGNLAKPDIDIVKAVMGSTGLSNPMDLLKMLEKPRGDERISTPPDQQRAVPQQGQGQRQLTPEEMLRDLLTGGGGRTTEEPRREPAPDRRVSPQERISRQPEPEPTPEERRAAAREDRRRETAAQRREAAAERRREAADPRTPPEDSRPRRAATQPTTRPALAPATQAATQPATQPSTQPATRPVRERRRRP